MQSPEGKANISNIVLHGYLMPFACIVTSQSSIVRRTDAMPS